MGKTKIEWCDEVWNPVTGCTKVSQGCKNCYAERIFSRPYPGRAFTDVRCHPDRLDAPLRMRKPRRIFVNSMSDLFHENVPWSFIDQVLSICERCPQHTFQILTKRPARMRAYFDESRKEWWPLPNVWLGVSVEDQPAADERIPLLLHTPAAVRWISAEPLLGTIDLDDELADGLHALGCGGGHDCGCGASGLDWVVAGGESGPKARPSHPDWFRSLRDQCAAAGVAFHFKQWGEWLGPIQDGAMLPNRDQIINASDVSVRIGKKAAGRTLDGRIHDEYPA